MRLASLFFAASLVMAQGALRQPIAPNAGNGWARVVVGEDGATGIWIGDAAGRSVPFLWESDAHWSAIPLMVQHSVFGRDAKGNATGAFSLQVPEGWSRGDREQVKLSFSLQAAATPWVVQVELARRGDGGAFIALDDGTPRFLYDLGPDRRATTITVPWDSEDYRVTLKPVQGDTPKALGVEAEACTLPSELKEDERLDLMPTRNQERGTSFDLALPGKRRLTGLEVRLKPPVAPVHALVESLRPSPDDRGLEISFFGAAELWNLPALNTQSTRIAVSGTADRLRLSLPDSVEVDSVTALIRHRRLFFPAEAGQTYFLHFGAQSKTAPGSLAALPASSRAFYASAPLSLGTPEPDPQAVFATPDPTARFRNLLPWGVGILILLLGFWGWSLMRPSRPA